VPLSASIFNTVLTDVAISHTFRCPLGGGFWVYAPEVGAVANCTEDGVPICTCTPLVHLNFEDGTEIRAHAALKLLEKLIHPRAASEPLNDEAAATAAFGPRIG
jgi:hypothetical protein